MALKLTLGMQDCLWVLTLILDGFKFPKVSSIRTNFQFFPLDQNISLSEY